MYRQFEICSLQSRSFGRGLSSAENDRVTYEAFSGATLAFAAELQRQRPRGRPRRPCDAQSAEWPSSFSPP
jgi:hypothetical protein